MSEGQQKVSWQHTSFMAALHANIHKDPKRRPYKPSDFDPLDSWGAAKRKGSDDHLEVGIDILKVFVPGCPC